MILEIDAGNTFIKWRVVGDEGAIEAGRLSAVELEGGVPDCWAVSLTAVRVSSVAGDRVNESIKRAVGNVQSMPVEFAKTEAVRANVVNSYEDPSRMGVDRWLAMLAAFNDCREPCCVVDCGSAITIDYVDGDGRHLGGYIMPGLQLMKKGLLSNTAEIDVDQSITNFDMSLGRHTSAAVIHGINYQFSALAEKVVADIERNGNVAKLYVTGGDGELFCSVAGRGLHVPNLVMDGLAWGLSGK
jgi:type III pantothenate kinase